MIRDLARGEVTAKIVYYGPGLAGKRTNLEALERRAPSFSTGKLTQTALDCGDRMYFLELALREPRLIGGLRARLQLSTVGFTYENSSREALLQGADGVVFVVDSLKLEENVDCFLNLEENLRKQGRALATLPHVIQYNKRDDPKALPLAELESAINRYGAPTVRALAQFHEGVFSTLLTISALVFGVATGELGAMEPPLALDERPPQSAAATPEPPSQPALERPLWSGHAESAEQRAVTPPHMPPGGPSPSPESPGGAQRDPWYADRRPACTTCGGLRSVTCPSCGGYGCTCEGGSITCPDCKGKGWT